MEIYLYKNAVLNNTAAFTKAISATQSIAEIDVSATSFTGGDQICALVVGNGNSDKIDLQNEIEAYLETTDVYTVAARCVSASTSDLSISMQWAEDL